MDQPPLGRVSRDERRGLYWATNGWFPETEDRVIHPRGWVASSDLFAELLGDPSPGGIAALGRRFSEFDQNPSLDKCVAELVYEQVREHELPEAPSRLSCLFAARDGLAAINFAWTYMPVAIDPVTRDANVSAALVSTADGAWVELDMNLFSTMPVSGRGESGIAQVLDALNALARSYWQGEESGSPFSEILAEKLWRYTAFGGDGASAPPYEKWVVVRRDR